RASAFFGLGRGARHSFDGSAAFAEHEPGAFDFLPVRFARRFVADEGVERVPLVGDLLGAVFALGRAEIGRHRAFAGGRLARRDDRRPGRFAFAVTDGGHAFVRGELVDGHAFRVDQHGAEAGDFGPRDRAAAGA